MAFLGPLLGAAVSAGGIGMQMGAQQDANNINWENLFETRRRNAEAEKLQKATRTDAYGNKLKYIDGIGWQIDTTPMTKSILDAQQLEEQRSLTQDAPRNRAAAERMDVRSKMGDEAFKEDFNKFRYRPQRSEDADVADATNELLSARRKGMDESNAVLARQLIRTGGSSELSNLYKTSNDEYAKTLEDAMLQGKSLGRQRHAQSYRDDLAGPGAEVQMMKAIADGTTTSPVSNPSYNGDLTSRSDSALQQMVQGIRQSQANSSAASGRLAGSLSQSPDLGGLAGMLARLNFGDGDKPEQQDQTQSYDPFAGSYLFGPGSGSF